MDIEDLPTPSLILDRAVVTRNTQRMGARMTEHGVALRPHVKTAKSVPVAKLATVGHSGAITVSTLAEAAYFLSHGFADMTYAVCLAPNKVAAAATLIAQGADLKVIIDSIDAAPTGLSSCRTARSSKTDPTQSWSPRAGSTRACTTSTTPRSTMSRKSSSSHSVSCGAGVARNKETPDARQRLG